MSSKKNLFRNGKIATLLDEMEADALAGIEEAKEKLHEAWRERASKAVEDKLEEDQQIQKDAYKLCRSLRKYVPFIETGAMTLAEAISCESNKKESVPAPQKKQK